MDARNHPEASLTLLWHCKSHAVLFQNLSMGGIHQAEASSTIDGDCPYLGARRAAVVDAVPVNQHGLGRVASRGVVHLGTNDASTTRAFWMKEASGAPPHFPGTRGSWGRTPHKNARVLVQQEQHDSKQGPRDFTSPIPSSYRSESRPIGKRGDE